MSNNDQNLEGGRNSSRVLKPPGGDSSNIFAASEPAGRKEPAQPGKTTRSRIFGADEATPTKAYVRRNPITGEGYQTVDQVDEDKIVQDAMVSEKAREQPITEAPKVVQTSIRVRNPPGGKSSGIF